MALFSRLFGKKDAAQTDAEPIEYKEFLIYPQPINEGGTYRIAARIVGQIDGEDKEHLLIRADTIQSKDQAEEASIGKAKQMIDEQGTGIFR